LSEQCQEYASALINETRTSKELEIILNYDHETIPGEIENESNTLGRLKLAIKCKQKKFVAHPHCQQLLVKLWYEGISGFRRRNIFVKFIAILGLAIVFPFLSIIYILFPTSKCGQILNQPFIKFVCHSASYIIFLGWLYLLEKSF
jgi:transient receptor potential cation channel subfamily C protein 4